MTQPIYELTDAQKQTIMGITEDEFTSLIDRHPCIRDIDPSLVTAIFDAGIKVGNRSIVEVMFA